MMKLTVLILHAAISVFIIGCTDQGDGAEPTEAQVVPQDLTSLILTADKIIITEGPSQTSKHIFESVDISDIAELSRALIIAKPAQKFHCMCAGTPAIHLYKNDTLLVRITNHHGQSVRCSLWRSDVTIVDSESWLEWFDKRNINEPRKEFEHIKTLREQSIIDKNRWIAAMPTGLAREWKEFHRVLGSHETSYLRTALNKSTPDTHEQIRALLTWHGSGAGPWSGHPAYESAAENMLLEYAITDIVSAIDLNHISNPQLEGAARLFAGWDFSQRFPNGHQEIPSILKAALWNAVKNTDDKDKLARAQQAFR